MHLNIFFLAFTTWNWTTAASSSFCGKDLAVDKIPRYRNSSLLALFYNFSPTPCQSDPL